MPSAIRGAWGRTTTPAPRTESGPAKFESAGKLKVGAKEASDVVALPGGRFLVVSDTSKNVTVVGKDGTATKLELPELKAGHSQLEGVAYDPERHHLFVMREEKSELLRYEWNPDKAAAPKLEKRRTLDLGGSANKGVEGLAYLAAEHSPTGAPQLLVTKEGKPRGLFLLGDGGGGKPLEVKLEDQVKSVCKDFSAVTVDPRTGNLFISSDASSTVAQVKLSRDGDKVRGRLVQSFPLRDGNKPLARVEGLATNEKGDLFVLTENDGALHHLKRK